MKASLKATRRCVSAKAGFTLIEVVIATFISVIGLAGAMSMGIWQLQATRFNEQSSEAVAAGQQLLETLIQDDYTSVVDGSATNGAYRLDWVVTPTNACKLIALTATWDTGKATHHVTMYDLFPDENVNGFAITE